MDRFSLGRSTILGIIVLSLFSLSAGSLYALGTLRERLLEIRNNNTTTDSNSATTGSDVSKTGSKLPTALDLKEYIISGKTKRFYLLHIPKTYNKEKGAPLVLAFHGGMGTAQSLKNGYDIVRKSDKEGFIVAFPNGTSRLKSGLFATWNAGNCCGYAIDSEADDVAFVKKVVDTLKKDYKVSKVFAMGMSNGGMFSYRLACDIPEYFDAIGAVAGTDNTITCTPKESTPIMHIHALNDDHVLYYGGKGPGSKDNHEPEFISVPATMEKWKKINQCSDTPTRVETGSGFTCDIYRNCASGSPMKLCTTETGGHSWPGNPDRGNSRGGDKEPPSQAINATDELWNFFKLIK